MKYHKKVLLNFHLVFPSAFTYQLTRRKSENFSTTLEFSLKCRKTPSIFTKNLTMTLSGNHLLLSHGSCGCHPHQKWQEKGSRVMAESL